MCTTLMLMECKHTFEEPVTTKNASPLGLQLTDNTGWPSWGSISLHRASNTARELSSKRKCDLVQEEEGVFRTAIMRDRQR